MLTFSDTEEKAVEKAIAALADMIPLEAIQPPHSPALVFPGLEIRLHQRRVLKNGIDVSLTRLEYDALCYLAASPGRVFTKAQIFEERFTAPSAFDNEPYRQHGQGGAYLHADPYQDLRNAEL